MAQNRNNETEGKDEKKEERGEETSVRLKELFVRERGKKTSQCEIHCIFFEKFRYQFTEMNDPKLLQIVIFKHGPE